MTENAPENKRAGRCANPVNNRQQKLTQTLDILNKLTAFYNHPHNNLRTTVPRKTWTLVHIQLLTKLCAQHPDAAPSKALFAKLKLKTKKNIKSKTQMQEVYAAVVPHIRT